MIFSCRRGQALQRIEKHNEKRFKANEKKTAVRAVRGAHYFVYVVLTCAIPKRCS